MEQRGNKRIPMIIRELLSQQAEHEKAPQWESINHKKLC
jgi:hypothetical protein